MIIRCGWCKRDMGEKEPLEDKAITHGICQVCKESIVDLEMQEVLIKQKEKEKRGHKTRKTTT